VRHAGEDGRREADHAGHPRRRGDHHPQRRARPTPTTFRNVARRLADERGWFLTDQFNNPANILAHETGTAREILEQTGGHISAFVAGAGTGGTLTGVGRRLRRACPDVRIVLADPVGSLPRRLGRGPPARPRPRSYAVEGIGASEPPHNLHRDVIHSAERIPDAESFEITRRLIREEGLLVGGSAGTNVAAALRVAAQDDLRGPVVTVLPDSWDRYRGTAWLRAWT
jgi:cysteine synthase